jgi:hypothetical protein
VEEKIKPDRFHFFLLNFFCQFLNEIGRKNWTRLIPSISREISLLSPISLRLSVARCYKPFGTGNLKYRTSLGTAALFGEASTIVLNATTIRQS